MLLKSIFIVALVGTVLCKPQSIGFGRNGELSAEFGGYKASVGGQNGFAVSAQTPNGQRAGAGIGGGLNGGPNGGAYAGATAGSGIGASAAIGGGSEDGVYRGGVGAEAHANGQSSTAIKLAQTTSNDDDDDFDDDTPVQNVQKVAPVASAVPAGQNQVIYQKRVIFSPIEQYPIPQTDTQTVTKTKTTQVTGPSENFDFAPVIYRKTKIFSPVRYQVVKYQAPVVQRVQKVKTVRVRPQRIYVKKIFPGFLFQKFYSYPSYTVQKQYTTVPINTQNTETQEVHSNPKQLDTRADDAISGSSGSSGGVLTVQKTIPNTFFDSIFNIPIQTLRAVNQLLNTKASGGGYTVTKTAQYY